MRTALDARSRSPRPRRALPPATPADVRRSSRPSRHRARPRPKPSRRPACSRRCRDGRFVISVEIDPPRSDPHRPDASRRRGCSRPPGVDVVNISDSAMARVRMGAMAVAFGIQHDLDLECVIHFTTRDRNLMALESELLGAHALGVRNILALTGDPPRVGDYPTGHRRLGRRLDRPRRDPGPAQPRRGRRRLARSASAAGFTIACALDPTAAEPGHRMGSARAQARGRRPPRHDPAALRRPAQVEAMVDEARPAVRPWRLPGPGPARRPAAPERPPRRVPPQRGPGHHDPRRAPGRPCATPATAAPRWAST